MARCCCTRPSPSSTGATRYASLDHALRERACRWRYEELDLDVFSDELLKPAYVEEKCIAAVALMLTRLS